MLQSYVQTIDNCLFPFFYRFHCSNYRCQPIQLCDLSSIFVMSIHIQMKKSTFELSIREGNMTYWFRKWSITTWILLPHFQFDSCLTIFSFPSKEVTYPRYVRKVFDNDVIVSKNIIKTLLHFIPSKYAVLTSTHRSLAIMIHLLSISIQQFLCFRVSEIIARNQYLVVKWHNLIYISQTVSQ